MDLARVKVGVSRCTKTDAGWPRHY
jgi:hypothetical protein